MRIFNTTTNYIDIYKNRAGDLVVSVPGKEPLVYRGGGAGGVSTLNGLDGKVKVVGGDYINVDTDPDNGEIKVDINGLPSNPVFFYAYAYEILFMEGSFPVNNLTENDWDNLRNSAINSNQRGYNTLLGFTYDGEGSSYGVSICSDFNSTGYWVEFLTEHPQTKDLWLVKFYHPTSGTPTGTAHQLTNTSPVPPIVDFNISETFKGDFLSYATFNLFDNDSENQASYNTATRLFTFKLDTYLTATPGQNFDGLEVMTFTIPNLKLKNMTSTVQLAAYDNVTHTGTSLNGLLTTETLGSSTLVSISLLETNKLTSSGQNFIIRLSGNYYLPVLVTTLKATKKAKKQEVIE